MTPFAASKTIPIVLLWALFATTSADVTYCTTQADCDDSAVCDDQFGACVPVCTGATFVGLRVQSNVNTQPIISSKPTPTPIPTPNLTYVCYPYLYSFLNEATGEYNCPPNTTQHADADSCCPGYSLFVNGSCQCPTYSLLSSEDACVCQGESYMETVSAGNYTCQNYAGSSLDLYTNLYACPVGALAINATKSCVCQMASTLILNDVGGYACRKYPHANFIADLGFFECPTSASQNDNTRMCECPENYEFTGGDSSNDWTCTECPTVINNNMKFYRC